MKNTIYVIGPSELFNAEFAKFQNGEGHYAEVDFKNSGGIRYSNDGTKVLLEELPEKFNQEHLEREDVSLFTHAQIKEYLKANKSDWGDEED